jgi:uncharacterized RDD family membrane protein YckC
MSDTEWFFAQNNRQGGPVSLEDLRAMLNTGRLSPSDLVWTEGMPEWTAALSVPELLPDTHPLPLIPEPAPAPVTLPTLAPGMRVMDYHTPALPLADYAGFWLRFVAFLVDYLIIFFAEGIMSLAIWGIARSGGFNHTALPVVTGKFILFTLLRWLYYASMESAAPQGTVGKMLLKLKVTDLEGQPITFARASGRHFGKYLSGAIFMIGFMMAGWTRRKQALHDMLAGCLVVRKE